MKIIKPFMIFLLTGGDCNASIEKQYKAYDRLLFSFVVIALILGAIRKEFPTIYIASCALYCYLLIHVMDKPNDQPDTKLPSDVADSLRDLQGMPPPVPPPPLSKEYTDNISAGTPFLTPSPRVHYSHVPPQYNGKVVTINEAREKLAYGAFVDLQDSVDKVTKKYDDAYKQIISHSITGETIITEINKEAEYPIEIKTYYNSKDNIKWVEVIKDQDHA